MFNFEDRIDLIFKTGFFNFQSNFSRVLALAKDPRRGPCSSYALKRGLRALVGVLREARPGGPVGNFWQFSAKCCSFLAVSAPIFARKYAFWSMFFKIYQIIKLKYLKFQIWQIFQIFATSAIFC